MPSVLDQPWPSADSTSGEGRKTVPLFFRYFNGHCAVTPQHLRETGGGTFRHFRHFRRCAGGRETPQSALVRSCPAASSSPRLNIWQGPHYFSIFLMGPPQHLGAILRRTFRYFR